jgi:hypothetical protein
MLTVHGCSCSYKLEDLRACGFGGSGLGEFEDSGHGSCRARLGAL